MSDILTRLRGYNPPDRTTHDRRISQDIHDAADEIDRLRLALETATREAEEERRTAEATLKFLGRIAEVTWEAGLPGGDREQTLKNVRALASRPAPPADAQRVGGPNENGVPWRESAGVLLVHDGTPPADAAREADRLVREVFGSGVEFDDQRVGYVVVQIDRQTWDEIRSYISYPAPAPSAEEKP